MTENTSTYVIEIITNREAHLGSLKHHLFQAQNRMKMMADKNRTYFQFQVGDQVLLKLQPYTQLSVANRPYPKLAYKYFGPYKVLERIGAIAYKLELPDNAMIHPVFHISQLKPFVANYTPVFDKLPMTTDLEATAAIPYSVIDRRLVKKGNRAIPQVRVTWTGLPSPVSTQEDYNVLRECFLEAPAWGQASSQAGGGVTADAVTA